MGRNKGSDPQSGPSIDSPALPVVRGSGRLEVRSRGQLARRSTSADLPPSGDHLPVTSGLPLREECWSRLPVTVVSRMIDLAGEQIEWWAHGQRSQPARGRERHIEDRPSAVLIGTKGAVLAEPRVDSRHRPVYTIDCHILDPGSHRRTEVVYRPTSPSVPSTAPAETLLPTVREQPVPGLDPAALELLSNLPVRAQRLLTAPFDEQHPVLSRHWHYEGTTTRFDVFGVVLIGTDQLTLAHGSRITPVGHTEQASHWSLVCRRAKVLGQIRE